MCNLLGVMNHQGFELIASVDQNIGADNVGECAYPCALGDLCYATEAGR